MNHAPAAQIFTLGDLAATHGHLGPSHSRATMAQMETATSIVTDPYSYGATGKTVVCVEDRLHRPDPRLAGGALSLALMHNLLYGGDLMSQDLHALKARHLCLALHDDCGALKLVATGFVQGKLSDVNADGYKLLSAMGINVPMAIRQRIVTWAGKLSAQYVDLDAVKKAVDEIDNIEGQHNAVFATVSLRRGESFIGGPRLQKETDGLLSFVFDPWAARPNAQQIGGSGADQAAAEALAWVFTAQVFLALGAADLKVALHR